MVGNRVEPTARPDEEFLNVMGLDDVWQDGTNVKNMVDMASKPT